MKSANSHRLSSIKLTIFVLVCLFGAPSPKADEAAARALAGRIVDLVGGAEVIQKNHAATLDRVQKELISRGMPAEGSAEVRKTMGDWFTENFQFQEIRSRAAAIYMGEFTEDELRQMVAFYETPVGQKALRKMAVLGLKVIAMAEKFTAEKQDSLKAALKPIFLKYGMSNLTGPSMQRGEADRSVQDTNWTSSLPGSRR